MPNVVEVLITGRNLTGPALAEAEGGALSLGKVMNKVGLLGVAAVAGITVEGIKMATTFDSAMTMISTQAGVQKSKLGELQKGVLDLAGQVGFSPTSLADALYHIESSFASVGIKGPKALDLLKVAAEGAAVGHSDLVDTTNALDAAIASNISGVKNYSQAMGVLNATVGAGDMKMQDLAEAFGTGVLAAVKGFGLSIKDVGAALAVFGDNNIRGAKAGTDLRMAVQALAAPTKAGDALFKQWGMTQGQLADDMRTKGLLGALQDLQSQMVKNGISADQQGQIITEAFGKKAGVGLMILEGQMGRLESKYPDLARGADKFGGAWQQTTQTTAQKLKDLQAGFDALMVEVGNRLMPVVTSFLTFMQKNINWVGPLALALVSLAGGLKIVAVGFDLVKIAMMAGPWGAVAAAVIALAVVIIKYHTDIWNFIVRIWNDVYGFLKKVWSDIVSFAQQWWPVLLGPAGLIIKYHNDVWNFIQSIWHAISGFLSGVWSGIVGTAKAIWNGIYDAIVAPIERAYHDVVGIIDKIGSAVSHIPGAGVVGKVASFLGLAQGGVVGAALGGVQGGMRLVGENGPELVRLPAGSTVYPTANTQGMLAGAGGAAIQIVVSPADSFDSAFGAALMKNLRFQVRTVGGGNVQKALGRA